MDQLEHHLINEIRRANLNLERLTRHIDRLRERPTIKLRTLTILTHSQKIAEHTVVALRIIEVIYACYQNDRDRH